MNYRHAFHAGNFADVVKHALLTRALVHLRKKEAAFRVIDTHAGTGRTNLTGNEALRGGEWQRGIGHIFHRDLGPAAEALLAPYREALATFNPPKDPRGVSNPQGELHIYPGSPLLIRHFLRSHDRLIACELETGAAAALTRNLRGDPRVKAIAIDGWTALSAYIPPKERRGLILIDPPYEERDELSRLATALAAAHAKWRTGMMLAWYPIKDPREISAFLRAAAPHLPPETLCIELSRTGAQDGGLSGTGMIAVHPPFTLAADAKLLLPALAKAFWPDEKALIRVENLRAPGA